MGGVSSSQADSAAPLFLKSPSRFFLSSLNVSVPTTPPTQLHPDRHIIGTPGGPSLILPNHSALLQTNVDPSSLAVSTQSLDSKRLVEYIQDPDPKGNPPLLLKLPANTVFKFKISIQTNSQPINNLTFIAAPSTASLDNILIDEFLENPNIINEENVVLLGDYASDQNSVTTFEFVWKTSPPLPSPLFKSDERGMKLVLCFAEYDKRDHSLKQLARFTVWIEPPPTSTVPKINTSLETLPEAIESPLMSTSSSPLLRDRDSSSPSGLTSYYFPPNVLANDINRLTLSRSGSPTTAKRNSIGAHSTPPPPNFPAPAVPTASSPELQPIDIVSPTLVIPDTTEPPSVSSMIIPEPNAPLEPEVSDSRDKKAVSSVPRPRDNNTSQPEDGPLFRATIAALEKKTGLLKIKVKKLLKRSIMVHERQTSLVEAHSLFLQSIQEIADTEIPSFQPLVKYYFHTKGQGPYTIVDVLRKSAADLQNHVVDPLRRLYEQEIKSFDQRKKDFDDESREYYAWLSRYLSVKQEAKGKKKSESDTKYAEKRKAFELRRFDYYSYIQDLHGGRKQQLVTYNLGLFAELEVKRFIAAAEHLDSTYKEELLGFVSEIKEANREWTRQRTEREERRRAIERSTKDTILSAMIISPTSENFKFNPDDSHLDPSNPVPVVSPSALNSAATNNAVSASTGSTSSAIPISMSSHSSSSSAPSKSADVLRMQSPVSTLPLGSPEKSFIPPPEEDEYVEKMESNRRKEGLLWAMSRPGGFNDPINLNKTGGWHKFWVVLAAGKLCEYTNWKQGLDLHNDPINLKVALVREARNAERRFCFEVVTPHYKRVYQATSEEDMQNWIRAINNGISSSLEGTSHSIKDFNISSSEQSTLRPVHTVASSYDPRISPVSTVPKFRDDHSYENKPASGENNLSDNLKEEFSKINSRKVSLHRRTSTQKNVYDKVAQYKPSIKPAKPQQDYAPHKAKPAAATHRVNEIVYSVDPSNRVCADCGLSSKVEWISINLLVILCIDCSGVHRSLGSHISKVRSLNLDTVSFTPELIILIKSVNNAIINSIWEAKLPQPKSPTKITENRAAFIREKYIEKKYVNILDRPNAYLRQAVQQKDIIGILRALASRANTNTFISTGDDATTSSLDPSAGPDPGAEENMIMYALRTAPGTNTTFPVAELLILNTLNTTIPASAMSSPDLSKAAIRYLNHKIALKTISGTLTSTTSTATSATSTTATAGTSVGSTQVPSQLSTSAPASSSIPSSGYHVQGGGAGSSVTGPSSHPLGGGSSGGSGGKDDRKGSKFQKRLSFGNSSRT